jgi:hypothetical protein
LIVPLTSGALFNKPFDLDYSPPSLMVDGEMHPFYQSIVKDIYRKMDKNRSFSLTCDEMSNFGYITGNDYFKGLAEKDMIQKFGKQALTSDIGLTPQGFIGAMTDIA